MADISPQSDRAPNSPLYPNTPPEGVDQDGIYAEQTDDTGSEGWVDDDPLYGNTQPDIPAPKPRYPWPAEKFGMKYEDLFRKLAPRFNMCSVPLRSTAAFAQDVQYACDEASTPQELYDMLAARRAAVRKKLEDDFDRAEVVFSERHMPDLTWRQWLSMLSLLQGRSLSAVLGVVRAHILADDGSGRSMGSPVRENVGTTSDIHLHPPPGRAETLPPSPPASYSTDFTPAYCASPAPSADASLPDTLPAYMDSSPERSPPGSPPGDSQPRDPPPAEHEGDETIDPGAHPLPTTPTIPTCASPDAPALEDEPSSPASNKTASSKTLSCKTESSNAAASPATPPYVETVLEVPGCSVDAKGRPPAQPFILPPCPPSRKRRRARDDADDDEAASSPRQPKCAKR